MHAPLPDPETCHRALAARDARFDGVFFVGVATTGIYCRPVCPARLPKIDRCTFYPSAALAEAAGFRACFRCRPELAPGSAAVDARPRLLRAALARIDDGALGRESLAELAAGLGITARHLRRVFQAELGITPSVYARTRRLALAKRLLQDTALPVTEVAFAAGFGSVRRFNAVFVEQFGRPPSSVRRGQGTSEVRLRLDYRPPLAWAEALAFLRPRTFPTLEWIDGERWCRRVQVGGREGVVTACHEGGRVRVTVPVVLAPHLASITRRVRRVFDLDARPRAIEAALAGDPRLADSVASAPGLRVPGAWDGFELAVRTVLGQQVSVKAAHTLATRFVSQFGAPDAATVAALTPEALRVIGLPGARAHTLHAIATLWPELEAAEAPLERLAAVRGVGPWTTSYLAMRWLRDPDAFLAGDLIVRRRLGVRTPAQATRAAADWRPWRAYATLHLWRSA